MYLNKYIRLVMPFWNDLQNYKFILLTHDWKFENEGVPEYPWINKMDPCGAPTCERMQPSIAHNYLLRKIRNVFIFFLYFLLRRKNKLYFFSLFTQLIYRSIICRQRQPPPRAPEGGVGPWPDDSPAENSPKMVPERLG